MELKIGTSVLINMIGKNINCVGWILNILDGPIY